MERSPLYANTGEDFSQKEKFPIGEMSEMAGGGFNGSMQEASSESGGVGPKASPGGSAYKGPLIAEVGVKFKTA